MARKFEVKAALVSWVVRKVKINPNLLDDMEAKEIGSVIKLNKVVDAAEKMINNGESIWNIAQLK